MDISIALVGLLVGFLVGLTGVGGAALLTPILIYIGFNPMVAVGTDLFYNSITKLFGTFQHWRQRTVNWSVVGFLASGSIPGAAIAIGMLKLYQLHFHSQEKLINAVLGFMLVFVAASILLRQFSLKSATENNRQAKPVGEKRWITAGIGFVLGFIVGLTSIGSGSLFAIFLIFLFRLSSSEVVGTDIAHAFFLVSAAGLLHAGLGNVNYGLAFNLLAGSIPGVLAGSSLSAKLPPRPLRAFMAVLILISGIKLL